MNPSNSDSRPKPVQNQASPLVLDCPSCGHSLRLLPQHIGAVGSCVSCKSKLKATESAPGVFEAVLVGEKAAVAVPQPAVKKEEPQPQTESKNSPWGFSDAIDRAEKEKKTETSKTEASPEPAEKESADTRGFSSIQFPEEKALTPSAKVESESVSAPAPPSNAEKKDEPAEESSTTPKQSGFLGLIEDEPKSDNEESAAKSVTLDPVGKEKGDEDDESPGNYGNFFGPSAAEKKAASPDLAEVKAPEKTEVPSAFTAPMEMPDETEQAPEVTTVESKAEEKAKPNPFQPPSPEDKKSEPSFFSSPPKVETEPAPAPVLVASAPQEEKVEPEVVDSPFAAPPVSQEESEPVEDSPFAAPPAPQEEQKPAPAPVSEKLEPAAENSPFAAPPAAQENSSAHIPLPNSAEKPEPAAEESPFATPQDAAAKKTANSFFSPAPAPAEPTAPSPNSSDLSDQSVLSDRSENSEKAATAAPTQPQQQPTDPAPTPPAQPQIAFEDIFAQPEPESPETPAANEQPPPPANQSQAQPEPQPQPNPQPQQSHAAPEPAAPPVNQPLPSIESPPENPVSPIASPKESANEQKEIDTDFVPVTPFDDPLPKKDDDLGSISSMFELPEEGTTVKSFMTEGDTPDSRPLFGAEGESAPEEKPKSKRRTLPLFPKAKLPDSGTVKIGGNGKKKIISDGLKKPLIILVSLTVLTFFVYLWMTPERAARVKVQLTEWLEPGAVILEKLPFGIGENFATDDVSDPTTNPHSVTTPANPESKTTSGNAANSP